MLFVIGILYIEYTNIRDIEDIKNKNNINIQYIELFIVYSILSSIAIASFHYTTNKQSYINYRINYYFNLIPSLLAFINIILTIILLENVK